MKTYLFDVDVLIAWLWPRHEAHKLVGTWFLAKGAKSWATCPITQNGFIRVLSNPKISGSLITPGEAHRVLEKNLELQGHHFWPIDASYGEVTSSIKSKIYGHKQIADAYLLGLAIKNEGILVTLDPAINDLAGKYYAGNLLVLEQGRQ